MVGPWTTGGRFPYAKYYVELTSRITLGHSFACELVQ